MKKIIFLFSILTFLFSQAEITNIQASQRTDGSQIVDITYDLLPDPVFEFFEITVKVSLDGGNSWSEMNNVQGDLGEIIEPGNGKSLTWNFGQQFGGTYSDQIKIKIYGNSYAIVDNNNNQELPFEMVTVAAGEYTFGENNETRTIDYDYEIMKYEVTDVEYVLYMMDKLNEPGIEGDECFDIDYDVSDLDGYNCSDYSNNLSWCFHYDDNDFISEELCCACGGGTYITPDEYSVNINADGLSGYYPGDANFPAGDYTYIDFNNSKISWNGEIFEVAEGNVNHPVTGVTWFGAWAFATHYGMEIPNQYEWEKAARGNTGYQWPFGNNFSLNQNGNVAGTNTVFYTSGGPTTPVGFFNGDTYQCSNEIGFTNNLFFSEYAEGTSNNKYLEIYNPTSQSVNLGHFSISKCNNGCENMGVFEYPATFNFSNVLIGPGNVYLICHESVDSALLSICDEFAPYLIFSNGDDAIALTNSIGTITYDIIGDLGDDPGTGWDACGVSNATKDHTLVRKASVMSGNSGYWEFSAGQDENDCEWIVLDQNDWSNAGVHSGPIYDSDDENLSDCQELITIDSVSPFGLYDMAGNVWEIVYDIDFSSLFIKGGSWANLYSEASSWNLETYEALNTSQNIGFRAMRIINQPSTRNIPKEKLNQFHLNEKNKIKESKDKE